MPFHGAYQGAYASKESAPIRSGTLSNRPTRAGSVGVGSQTSTGGPWLAVESKANEEETSYVRTGNQFSGIARIC